MYQPRATNGDMRKAIYASDPEEARALLARAPVVHLATTTADGAPVLRALHAVVDGDAIAFHGAPAGEKVACLGRAAVVGAEEIVASIPSWFLDPERACPATTYYRSAQAHGSVEEVVDPARKARLLAMLMAKHQPEGRHVPIDAEHPLYAKAVRGLLVAEVRVERWSAKVKLGQNRTPEQRARVIEALWRRGAPGDARAVGLLLRRFPDLPRPSFARPRGDLTLEVDLEHAALDDAVHLLARRAYWLEGLPPAAIRAALEASSARVGARDAGGRLVAFARAVSDGKVAWIYDVVVDEALERRGVGGAVLELLLDHPAVRAARHVRLSTRDAMPFYARRGFRELADAPRHPWRSTEMILSRG